MAAPTGNLTKWWPSISETPTPEETALHTRLLYNATNDHDQAITLLSQKVAAAVSVVDSTISSNSSTSSAGVSSFNGGVGDIVYFPGMGTTNNQLGNTTYTTQQTDNGGKIIVGDSSSVIITLNGTMTAPWFCIIDNDSSSIASLSPSLGSLNGEKTIQPGGFGIVFFDGANFWCGATGVMPDSTAMITHEWLNSYDNTTGVFGQSQPAFTDISGVATPAQIPVATDSTIGGVEAVAAIAHEWVNQIDTSGVPHLSQPAFTDISGTATPGQLPIATTSALGVVEPDGTTITVTVGGNISATQQTVPSTIAVVTHQWLASYNASTGLFTQSQPAFTDISGTAAPGQLPVATTSAFGAVKPDGTTITIAAGVISSTGGGGSGISGLTAGYIPIAGSSTTITANSHMDDGVTTSGKITSTEPIAVPAMFNSATKTTLPGATSGNATFCMPEQGPSYKKVVIYCNACIGATATYTFPTPFLFAEIIVSTTSNALGSGVVVTATTTGCNITASGSVNKTGFIILEGF